MHLNVEIKALMFYILDFRHYLFCLNTALLLCRVTAIRKPCYICIPCEDLVHNRWPPLLQVNNVMLIQNFLI